VSQDHRAPPSTLNMASAWRHYQQKHQPLQGEPSKNLSLCFLFFPFFAMVITIALA